MEPLVDNMVHAQGVNAGTTAGSKTYTDNRYTLLIVHTAPMRSIGQTPIITMPEHRESSLISLTPGSAKHCDAGSLDRGIKQKHKDRTHPCSKVSPQEVHVTGKDSA